MYHSSLKSPYDGQYRHNTFAFISEYDLWVVVTERSSDIEGTLEQKRTAIYSLAFFLYLSLVLLVVVFLLVISRYRRRLNRLRSSNAVLEQQAHTDHLTGVYNRRQFEAFAYQELARKQRYGNSLSLVILDVDFFKQVNDIHGHTAGDDVLIQLASLLQRHIRPTDLVARMGGEEFVVLLPHISLENAKIYAEHIREKVEATDIYINSHGNKQMLNITVSIGIAIVRETETVIAGVLARADEALYEAKHAGRNQIRWKE